MPSGNVSPVQHSAGCGRHCRRVYALSSDANAFADDVAPISGELSCKVTKLGAVEDRLLTLAVVAAVCWRHWR